MFRTYSDTIRTTVADRVDRRIGTKYYCEFCDDDNDDRIWDSEPDLEIHRRNVHKKEINALLAKSNRSICTVCLHQQKDDKSSLIKHIITHHLLSSPDSTYVKREIFVCDYCDRIFFNKQLLNIHISSLHLLKKKEKKDISTTCPACFNTLSMKSVWFHFLNHGIIHTASCPICLKTFDETNDLIKHFDTHPGFYNCSICSYETKKEYLYRNHLLKHKKNINCDDYKEKNVSKYFIPQSDVFDWSKKFVNVLKGIKLDPKVKICILCRAICLSKEEMLRHIYGDHSSDNTTQAKVYLCSCGEVFLNNILLKHHIFKLKGNHKVFNGLREDLDILLEQSKDWESCNSNSEPGTLCIDDHMDVDLESNSEESVIITKPIDPIMIDESNNDTMNNDMTFNDTQNDSNNSINDSGNGLKSNKESGYECKSSNDNGSGLKSSNDNGNMCKSIIDSDWGTGNDLKINNTLNSQFETHNDKEFYEQILVVRDDGIQLEDTEGTDQVVYRLLLPADSGEGGSELFT